MVLRSPMVVKVIEQFNTAYEILDKIHHITGSGPPLKLLTKPPRIPIRLSALIGSMIRDVSLKEVSKLHSAKQERFHTSFQAIPDVDRPLEPQEEPTNALFRRAQSLFGVVRKSCRMY